MMEPHSDDKLSFRAHIIRVHGRKRDTTVRVLLVETTNIEAIYEGFAPLSKCMRWMNRLSSVKVPKEESIALIKLLERKKLATIHNVHATPQDLELLGLYRADSQG